MKRIIASFIIAAAYVFSVQAQGRGEVVITERQAGMSGDNVTVQFRMDIGKGAARNGRTLIYRPVVSDGTHSWQFSPVIIEGARARTAQKRHDWAAGHGIVYENPKYAVNGSTLVYNDSALWQLWMHGADLQVEVIEMGCCSTTATETMLIVGNLALPPAVEPVVVIEPQIVERPKTTGDRMAENVGYVRHSSEYEALQPGKLFDDDREGSLTVYYRQGSARLDGGYKDNYRVLAGMIEAIHKLQASPDSYVSHIVIAGFASPEGSFELNDRLGWSRAVAVKDYLMKYTYLNGQLLRLYNGSEDWRGLRLLVEQSDLYDKSQIMWIIDNVPIWDSWRRTGREGELMKLDNGRTYDYLYRNFFPLLRNAAYIKIYYNNK